MPREEVKRALKIKHALVMLHVSSNPKHKCRGEWEIKTKISKY